VLQLELLLEGCDGVVPFTMKALRGEVDLSRLLVAHFLSGGIDVGINFGFHSHTMRRLGRFDEVHNHFVADQHFANNFVLLGLTSYAMDKYPQRGGTNAFCQSADRQKREPVSDMFGLN
jgi:hypothetical protein